MGEWIKCSDGLPKDLKVVFLAYRPKDIVTAQAFRYEGQWFACPIFYNMSKSPAPFDARQVLVKDDVIAWHELPTFQAEDEE